MQLSPQQQQELFAAQERLNQALAQEHNCQVAIITLRSDIAEAENDLRTANRYASQCVKQLNDIKEKLGIPLNAQLQLQFSQPPAQELLENLPT